MRAPCYLKFACQGPGRRDRLDDELQSCFCKHEAKQLSCTTQLKSDRSVRSIQQGLLHRSLESVTGALTPRRAAVALALLKNAERGRRSHCSLGLDDGEVFIHLNAHVPYGGTIAPTPHSRRAQQCLPSVRCLLWRAIWHTLYRNLGSMTAAYA